MSESLVLLLRVVVSLGVVLALLWVLARRFSSSKLGQAGAAITVIARQSLSRHSGVAIVEVGAQRLLLGVADTGVTLLTELHAEPAAPVTEEFPGANPAPAGPRHAHPAQDPSALSSADWDRVMIEAQKDSGALTGSVLSPTTWRRTVAVLRGKQ